MNGSLSSAANGASAIAIGAYLAAVLFQGNANSLIAELPKDIGYLEFLVAAVILKVIADNPGTHDIAIMLIFGAVMAALIQFASKGTGNLSVLRQFANGDTGLFETVAKLFGAK